MSPDNIIQKAFIVGRPIVCTVQRYDTVDFKITLTDNYGTPIDLTDCRMIFTTSDRETRIWEPTIVDAPNGVFTVRIQPTVIGRCEMRADVTRLGNAEQGEDDLTTTFFIGAITVAVEEQEPSERIISLTEKLNAVAERIEADAEVAERTLEEASAAVSGANAALSTAQQAASLADLAAQNATTAATNATNAASSATQASETAVQAANEAVAAKDTAINASTVAINAANAATEAAAEAQEKASFANTAAERANIAAENAETATAAATQAINNLEQALEEAEINATAATGEPGTEVVVTKTGTGLQPTFNFTIPKGADGEKGDKGDPYATISVGTVATGEPGTDVVITNTGTTSEAVFNFTIPRGNKGDKGDKGDSGDVGYTAGDGINIDSRNVLSVANLDGGVYE